MKASNPVIMVQAYRLLVSEMYANNWDYPLHLGVTEAGEGEDGRMKSAIGIGALLQVFFQINSFGDTPAYMLEFFSFNRVITFFSSLQSS
jgi:4-hydroxy-3-methylbut-2-en-1-yl diphosphate synthase IspG/GcpE